MNDNRQWVAFSVPFNEKFIDEFKSSIPSSMRAYDRDTKINAVDVRCFGFAEKLIKKYFPDHEIVRPEGMWETTENIPEGLENEPAPTFVTDGMINLGGDDDEGDNRA